MKIFPPNAAGFIPAIPNLKAKIAGGLEGKSLSMAKAALFKVRLDVVETATFLVFVSIIALGTAYECWLLLTKRKPVVLRESPCITRDEQVRKSNSVAF